MERSRSHQRGQASILFVLGVLLVVGFGLWKYAGHFGFSLSSVRHGLSANLIATAVTGRVKSLLVAADPACSPALNSAFEKFRDYSAAAPPFELGDPDCLIPGDELSELSQFSLRIEELSSDGEALWRKIRLALSMSSTSEGSHVKTVRVTREIRLSAASLGFFGVLFTAPPSPKLIEIAEAKVFFHSSPFYTGREPLPLADIDALPTATTPSRVRFARPFYVRAPSLTVENDAAPDMDAFEKVYGGGIQTGVLASDAVDAYLPHNAPEWNHKIDYSYQFNGLGFPLPEPPTGGTTLIDCQDASQAFDPIRADITDLPSAVKGPSQLSATCGPSLESVPTFVQIRASSDLTLNLSSGDNLFCGVVVARTLTLHASDAGTYGIFGKFAVERIRIEGPEGAVFHFYNPSDNDLLEVTLPPGQSLANLSAQLKRLSTSTAYNLFLPMAETAPRLLPRAPTGYLESCAGVSGGVPNGYTMKP